MSAFGHLIWYDAEVSYIRDMRWQSLRRSYEDSFTTALSIHWNILGQGISWSVPPFNPRWIAERLGVSIMWFADDTIPHQTFVRIDEDSAKIVYHGKTRSERSATFDVAFGLGRVLTSSIGTYYDTIDHENIRSDQRIAYDLAMEIMLPEWSIRLSVDQVFKPQITWWKPWKWREELRIDAKRNKTVEMASLYHTTPLVMERRMRKLYRGT